MRTRLSVCNRKLHYASASDARAAALAFRLPLAPYRCDRCERFHLTSRTKGRRIVRPGADGSTGDHLAPLARS